MMDAVRAAVTRLELGGRRACVFGATVLAAFGAFAAPNCSVEMTTSGYAGSEALENFPVLIKFAENQPIGFSYSQFKQSGAADLAFSDANGNPLDFEIDTWNPDGTSCVWVRVPVLTKTTKIIATWGDEETVSAAAGSVWGGVGYAGVWHMNETENEGTANYLANDATGNGLTATPKISATAGDATMMVSRTDGAVGRARVNGAWEAGQKNGNCLEVQGYAGSSFPDVIAEKDEVTVSGWFYATVNNPNARFFGQKNSFQEENGFEVQQSGASRTKGYAKSLADMSSSGTWPSLNAWHHYAFVVRGTEQDSSFYCDGVERSSGRVDEIIANNRPFVIGNNCNCNEVAYSGSYDEVRLLPAAVSADWIRAEFDTVADSASFCKAGTVVDVTKFNTLTVSGSISSSVGAVSPAYGMVSLQDGEVVEFSAPTGEFTLSDGSYMSFVGYDLYVTPPGAADAITKGGDELSGRYVHTDGAVVRLVWRQHVRKGLESFETEYASIVSVPGYTGDTVLRNVPVLFRLAEGQPEGFSYADCQANGADIQFSDLEGHVFAHEIEQWKPSGESLIWVSLPRLAKGMSFRFGYGNDEVTTSPVDARETWAETGYAGVWHMNETENEGTANYLANDATGNGLTATPKISATAGDATMMVSRTDGAVGRARVNGAWEAGQKYGNCLEVQGYAGSSFPGVIAEKDEVTVSGWFYATVNNPNARFFGQKNSFQEENGFEVQQSGASRTKGYAKSLADMSSSGTWPSLNAWHHYAFVVRGTEQDSSFYCDGVERSSGRVDEIIANNRPFVIGNNCNFNEVAYSGSYDEVRLLPAAVSADWIKAEFNVVANAGFLSATKVHESSDVLTVEVSASDGGTVDGTGSYAFGTLATLTAVPAEGMSFKCWTGNLPAGVEPTDATIRFAVDQAYSFSVVFVETPVCAAFYSWKGHAEGEAVTVLTAVNDLGATNFAVQSVMARQSDGRTPAFSRHHPARTIYTDASKREVLTTDPGSIYFTSDANPVNTAGGDVIYRDIGTWISQQKACTLEFFVRSEKYRQYSPAWSMILSGEQQVFFAADDKTEALSLSVEYSSHGNGGRATPREGVTCNVNESWSHVALVYDRENQKVTVHRNYGAGVEKSICIEATTEDVPFCLGSGELRGPGNYFNGWISCLRITKGALEPRQFMRAGMGESPDDTLAVWDFRGRASTVVGSLNPVVGDAGLFTGYASSDEASVPRYVDDVPGEALYANAAEVSAKNPISKYVGSIELFGGQSGDCLVFPSLSTALSDCTDYTIEFFVKCLSVEKKWARFLGWNDTATAFGNGANVVTLPGQNGKDVLLQCNANPDAQSNQVYLTPTGDDLTDGKWHHFAVSYDHRKDCYCLIVDYDAAKAGTVSAAGKRTYTAAPLTLARFPAINIKDERFVGRISCLRVSNRVLDPTEFMVVDQRPAMGMMVIVR